MRRRTRSASAVAGDAAAAPVDGGAEAAARAAPRPRVEQGEGGNAAAADAADAAPDQAGGDAGGPALVPQRDLGGVRGAMARVARARAAHYAIFDDGDEAAGVGGGGEGGEGGNPAGVAAPVLGAPEHVGGEEARGLGMWAAANALHEGREAAAAAREHRLAMARAEAAAEAATRPAWVPSREVGGAGALPTRPRRPLVPGEAAPWAAAAGLDPPPPSPSRVPALADLAAGLIAANFDAVDSLAGLPDACRARLAAAAAAARTLDGRAARLLASGDVGSLVLPDATALDAAGLAAVLAAAASPRLESLDLSFCGRGLGSAAVRALAAAGPLTGLRDVAFRGAYRLTDADLATAVGAAPGLRSLAVTHAPLLTGVGSVSRLPSLTPRLVALDLSHARGVGRAALWAGLVGVGAPVQEDRPARASQQRRASQQQEAAGGGEGGDGATASLALPPLPPKPVLPALASLTLDGLAEPVDDVLLAALAASLPALARLSLAQCGEGVSDVGVAALADARGPGLRAVNLSGCSAITDASLDALVAATAGAASTTTPGGLQEVRLGGCGRVTDGGLARLVTAAAPTLRHLAIPSVPNAAQETVDALLACVGGRGALETLDVSWCRALPGDGLAHLVDEAAGRRGRDRLRRLDVYGVSQFTAAHLHGHAHDGLDVRGAVADAGPPPQPAVAALVFGEEEEEEEGGMGVEAAGAAVRAAA